MGLDAETVESAAHAEDGAVPVAFMDACCLVSLLKRELCLAFAEAKLCRLFWSSKVLDEAEWAMSRMLVVREGAGQAEAAASAATVRRSLEHAWPAALVADAAVFLDQCPPLRDANDRHVVAGALAAGASLIVTENLRDFPRRKLVSLSLAAVNADDFLVLCANRKPEAANAAIGRVRERLEGGGVLSRPFPVALAQAGLKALAQRI